MPLTGFIPFQKKKLRCDVQQDPYQDCSRCRKHNYICKIESNFKRVGKRSKNAEMEREIEELRRENVALKSGSHSAISGSTPSLNAFNSPILRQAVPPQPQFMASDEAVASLLDLKQGSGAFMQSSNTRPAVTKQLGSVGLTDERIAQLFRE
jgi:hypothetical protein